MKIIISALLCILLFSGEDLSAQNKYLFTGSASSEWNDTLNWTPYGIPLERDTVVITTSTVDASTGNDIHIAGLYFLGGTITGTDSIMISDTVSWSTGRFDGLGSTTFMKGSRAVMHGDYGRTIYTRNIHWNGDGYISGTGTFAIHGAELSIGGRLIISGIGNVYGTGVNGIAPKITVEEEGVLIKNGLDFILSLQLDVKGRVELDSGIFELRGDNNWTGAFSGAEYTTLFINKQLSTWMEGSQLISLGNFDIATRLNMDGNYSVGNRTQILDNSEHYFNGTGSGFGDSLIITGGNNHFNSDITLANYTYIDGGTNYNSGTLTVIDTLIWKEGAISDSGSLHIMKGAVAVLSGTRGKILWRKKMINEGTVLLNDGALQMTSGSEFHNHGSFIASAEGNMYKVTMGGDTGGAGPVFLNKSDGIYKKTGGSPSKVIAGINFLNEGMFELDHAILSLSSGFGGGQYRQLSGITKLDSSRFISTSEIKIDSGLFIGTGFVEGDLYNAGIVDPGLDSANFGIIYVQGVYTQDSSGTLIIDVGGRSPRSGYDQLTSSTSKLAGLLEMDFNNSFIPASGDRFRVVRWLGSSYDGAFDSISNLNWMNTNLDANYSLNDLAIQGKDEPGEIWMQFVGPSGGRPGVEVTVKLYYGNSGGKTIQVPVGITFGGTFYIDPLSQFYHFPSWIPWEEGVNRAFWDERVPYIYYNTIKKNRKIPLILSISPSRGDSNDNPFLEMKGVPVCSGSPSYASANSGAPMSDNMADCLWGTGELALGLLPGGACVSGVIDFTYKSARSGLPKTLGAAFADNAWNLGKCAASIIPGAGLVIKSAEFVDAMNTAEGAISTVDACASAMLGNENGKATSLSLGCMASMDPNEKVGPNGFTDLNYISGNDPSVFAIYFENVDTATAPAQTVYITDQLNPDHWDFSTFSFLPITIGDTTFSVPPLSASFDIEVDLRPENNLLLNIAGNLNEINGLIEWTFTSLDPATHKLTTDPLAGFLPPNVTYPEGQADVGYLLESNLDLPSGTGLGSDASIIFDTNDPILTNVWMNHIDRESPTSQMTAYTATLVEGEIPLNWSGQDAQSGIKNYKLFVSENEQAFEELLTTSDTSYMFIGDSCKSYSFFTVAIDSVGNSETDKDPEVLVSINPFQNTVITIDGSAEICQGDSVLLKAQSDTLLNYTWYRNEAVIEDRIDSLLYVSESGSYSVSVDRNDACTGHSEPVSIISHPLPEPVFSVNENLLSVQEGFQEYLWYFDNTLLPAVSGNSLLADASGVYVVQVTDSNGCGRLTDPLSHTIVSVDNLRSNGLLIYPNPAGDKVFISTAEESMLSIKIYDLLGRPVYISEGPFSGIHTISLDHFQSGSYLVRVQSAAKAWIQQLIVE